MPKGKASEVGKDEPTDKSKGDIDNLVSDVLGEPADVAPKSTLPKKGAKDAELDSEVIKDPERTSEEPSEEADEDADESGEATDQTEDEEVVPASKHKKVIQDMQKRIDTLVSKQKAEEANRNTEGRTQEDKLALLSVQDLTELRDNADEAMIDAKVAAKTEGVDASARVNELRQLKRQIDRTIQEVPKRFASKQMKHLESMMDTVKDIDPDVVNRTGDLWQIANRVYTRMPSLHRSETGMAEALAIATEYFSERKQVGDGRERTSTLQKQVANLKRKTNLDGKTRTANADTVANRKIRDRAIKGSHDDKLSFVKTLIPDDFLRPS